MSRLPNSDQITLSGGIATFAVVLTAWIVGVVALWTCWWRLSRIANSDDGSLGSTPPRVRTVAGDQRGP